MAELGGAMWTSSIYLKPIGFKHRGAIRTRYLVDLQLRFTSEMNECCLMEHISWPICSHLMRYFLNVQNHPLESLDTGWTLETNPSVDAVPLASLKSFARMTQAEPVQVASPTLSLQWKIHCLSCPFLATRDDFNIIWDVTKYLQNIFFYGFIPAKFSARWFTSAAWRLLRISRAASTTLSAQECIRALLAALSTRTQQIIIRLPNFLFYKYIRFYPTTAINKDFLLFSSFFWPIPKPL